MRQDGKFRRATVGSVTWAEGRISALRRPGLRTQSDYAADIEQQLEQGSSDKCVDVECSEARVNEDRTASS